MNLRAIANGVTQSINPNIEVTIKKYNGKTLNADGTVKITYTDVSATAQMQPEPSYKLQHIQGFTAGGVYKAFYFNDDLKGVTAPTGNDLIIVGAETYKVIEQQEGWYATSGWSKVVCQRTSDYVAPVEEENGTNN